MDIEMSREAALEAAALDFIAKVDRGEARSKESYAAFKAALSFTSPDVPAQQMPSREAIAQILARFHRNSCYPEAMDGELFAYADQIIAAFTSPESALPPDWKQDQAETSRLPLKPLA